MTIRKKTTLVSASAAGRALTLTALALSLAACTTVFESDRVDYRGAKKAAPLDVPPDLTQLQRDNRYAVPDGKGVATASSFQQSRGQQGAAPVAGAAEAVGPISSESVRIERAGDQRWLVVKQTPEQLWPQLRQFWEDNGFALEAESAATGTMETNYVEDRSKIPQDFLRNTLGRVFDKAWSTGMKDKFRTRLERLPDGSTEIYVSHRGVEEVLTGPAKETTTWTARPNDPGLEAQFLARMVAHLTGSKDVKTAQATVTNAPLQPQHAKLAGDKVEVDEGFDRAWRRVGLALDRVGFTVEDRDRVQGIYFVRYVDPDASKTEGFFKRLFTFGEDEKAKEAQRYRVLVKSQQGASVSEVTVQTNDGQVANSPTAAKILKLLTDELK
ncbi:MULTISPECIES: outer membrane protein assembly factor BamC [unclassified Massilia]|uniref:outer membrane protein assembly factor BamC n=1 Tax=unclassified Massilia TaxID=2609279 RepID=UPI001B83E32D|nr:MULTISPECIES: outer membrane protein assembly factor BamC [unclassified Massilia]MBQ5942123.1 outer membrane protein assembly factor BamC [Massilia sp. AB1]MBQ5965666.1 outer membrane protein assembly factor BamC [Massilia sp. ZL223]